MTRNTVTVTIPQPTDLDGTEVPLFEGSITAAANVLTDGTYLATIEETDEDGDPLAPVDGTVTIEGSKTTWRPFARTPETVIGARLDGTWCLTHAPEGAEPIKVGDLTWCEVPACDHEDHDDRNVYLWDGKAAMEDTKHAVLAATGIDGGWTPTGGGCDAYGIQWEDGRYLYVTNGDAQTPDGLWYSAGLYTTADDDEPRDVIHAPHNPVLLARNLRRVAAATATA